MRLALLSPRFFGYELDIADAFRAQHVEVDLFDERPYNSAAGRALLRVASRFTDAAVRNHFAAILEEMAGTAYDGLLVIKGEAIPTWFMERFEREHPRAKRLFYTYDSLKNSPHCLKLLPYFHELYSFDRADVLQDSRFRYKMLFYSPEYAPSADPAEYYASFIGTLHSDRFNFVKAVTRRLPPDRVYEYYYSQARWYFAMQRIVDSRMRSVQWSDASFAKLGRPQVAAVFRRSVAVIDYQRPGQSGLTMRTLEALASGAGLITTNGAIQNEEFYDPCSVLVVPSDPDDVDADAVADWVAALRDRNPRVTANVDQLRISSWVAAFIDRFTAKEDE